jgi:DNA-binding PadR family transcriptional regulator
VKAEWGVSDNNRRARYYTLTASGRKQLARERQEFDQLIFAIQKVFDTGKGERHATAPSPRLVCASAAPLRG